VKKKTLRIALIIVFNLCFFSFFLKTSYALTWPWQKKEQQQKIIDPQLYQSLQKRKIIEQYLQEQGLDWDTKINELPEEKRQQLIQEIGEIISFNSQPQPKFEKDDQKGTYTFTTGINGNASGQVPIGSFKVGVNKINDVNIICPEKLVLTHFRDNILYIGLNEGKGKVVFREEKSEHSSKAKIVNKTSLNLKPQDLVIQLFADKNENGNWDGQEQAVQWAGVVVELQEQGFIKTVQFSQGINRVEINKGPISFTNALEMFLELEMAGGQPEWIKLENGGPNQIFSWKNGSLYGQNFNLDKGSIYQVSLKNDTQLEVAFE